MQMAGLALVLYGIKAARTELAEQALTIGLPLVGIATVITVASLTDYLAKLWKAI